MHSKIFQITRTRVDKDDYMNEDTLMQGDDSFFDYCAEIDDEERQYHIDNFEAGRKPLPPKAYRNGLARSISLKNF